MGLLDRLLHPGESQDKETEPPPTAARTFPYERDTLTTADQIGRLLHDLAASRKLVTVHLKGTDETFMSTVLSVDGEHRHLTMDELNPAAGHGLLLRTGELRVTTRMEGVDVSFRTRLDAVDDSAGIAIYHLPFPEVVRYHHRRQAFRATVELSETIPVYLDTPQGGIVPGSLRDLSVGGLGAELHRRPVTPIERGQHLSACTIHLPEGEQVSSALEVRFVGRVPQSPRLRVGGRFVDMDPLHQRAIRRFVAELDRKRVKHQRRLRA
jgi:c-di-GMP-binding flagellar brake protein YcgR